MEDISKKALEYIKKRENYKKIIEDIILKSKAQPVEKPKTILMAGSPGAGKTEFSKSLITVLGVPYVRIDADEVREYLPGYTGDNSDLVQFAASTGVNKICDYVFKKKYDAIIDGTLSSYKSSKENIERSIKRERSIDIFYIFLDPIKAWEFAKMREKIEGRKISKDIFVRDFFKARENVNRLKKEYSENVNLFYVKKDYEHTIEEFKINITSIDKYAKVKYNKESLRQLLKDNV